ncbi:RNases MRP/P 32 subunit [Candida viswanathii]|uniref:Ribonuclease P protein subunit n=1 Tax=Candida viswanathii TaxID=5486 RepID=A0A367YHG0_9ASCO|nr:RNases MRP/P 32 subunit [Candida viswanathii]
MSLTPNNEVERHLLSRCYDSNSKIVELLETRYSQHGDQKSTILFKNITTTEPKKRGSLLSQSTYDTDSAITEERKRTTRLEVRNYISSTLTNQRKLIKKIQLHNRTKSTGPPFPLDKFLHKYAIPQFEDFATMNELWQKYMQDLLFQNGERLLSLASILPRLASADFNGCLLTVLQSRNTSVVGTRGIVIWDSQHSFTMVVPRGEDSKEWNETGEGAFSPSEMVGGLRVIPKKHTMFGFEVIDPSDEENCIGFTIVGSRFEIRSVDRAGKKFKNHAIDDIL